MPRTANDSTMVLEELLALSHELGREDRRLAILGEGNVSMRVSADSFLVKASGANLATLARADVTECRFDVLLPLLSRRTITDAAVDEALLSSRVDSAARKPSVEAIFHAYLLTLPGVAVVAHTHPIAVNQLLCSKHARAFATRRMFPDEIVCCGAESVFVPYLDPGLRLAQGLRVHLLRFIKRTARAPRVILLENHGLIALGATAESARATTLMATKSAEIFAGAAAMGTPRFLRRANIVRIAGRPDEHYRQKILGL